jgi:hypothetical protein
MRWDGRSGEEIHVGGVYTLQGMSGETFFCVLCALIQDRNTDGG